MQESVRNMIENYLQLKDPFRKDKVRQNSLFNIRPAGPAIPNFRNFKKNIKL